VQQGPFAPRELPRFTTTTGPAATVSSSVDFPVPPVIRPTLLRRFLDGTRTASPVAWRVLVTVPPLPPRRSGLSHQSGCDSPCCLRPKGEDSASGVCFVSRPPVGSLALRPGDSLTIPKMALSIGFISFVSSTHTIQATGLLILAPMGLTPTEHASLCWTHSLAKIRCVTVSSRPPRISRSCHPTTGLEGSRHRSKPDRARSIILSTQATRDFSALCIECS